MRFFLIQECEEDMKADEEGESRLIIDPQLLESFNKAANGSCRPNSAVSR